RDPRRPAPRYARQPAHPRRPRRPGDRRDRPPPARRGADPGHRRLDRRTAGHRRGARGHRPVHAREVPVNIHINGAPEAVGAGASVAEVVAGLTEAPRGVAGAVNGTVVPGSEWGTTRARGGGRVAVLTASRGG